MIWSFRAKRGEKFLAFCAKRVEIFYLFARSAEKTFFIKNLQEIARSAGKIVFKNSKPKRRSKSIDSLLRFLLPRPLFRLRAKFSKKPVTKPDARGRPAPSAEVALLFLAGDRAKRRENFFQKFETETVLKKCRFFTTFLTTASTFSASGKIFEKAGDQT